MNIFKNTIPMPNKSFFLIVAIGIAFCGAIMPYGKVSADSSAFISDGAGLFLNANSDPLIVTDNGSSMHDYYLHNVGHVSNSNATPFNGGSGYNSKYNGDQIVILENNSNENSCIGVDYSTLNLDTWDNGGCSAANNKTLMFVESGGWLISVGATNYEGSSTPTTAQVMTANCNQTGCRVLAANGNSSPASEQNWTY